ncbi:DUF445 domain-containing protein [Bacillus solitudinis]|uniref:DUF445 domain-containing protein n=1 Tax=Bacillus solitudinis TaxID=2014074 RepID=UPI001D0CF69C|nr:DUF445 family protein [Bacillus solitudinis]
MVNNVLFIGFMVAIGSAIGGMTNSLAIKMLFRPYKEMKIGNWRVPFTPGLIPKRHDELSKQLGRMVVQYLLTAEGLEKKMKSSGFVEGLTNWLQAEVKTMLHSEKSVADFMKEKLSIPEPKKELLSKTENIINTGIDRFFEYNREQTIATTLPTAFQSQIEQTIPKLTEFILQRGQAFIAGPEGKRQLSQMIDRFFIDKGALVQMISMFLGNERLVDKVQPELQKFLRDKGTKVILEQMLTTEWKKLKEKQVADFEKHVNKEELVAGFVQIIDKHLPPFQWLEQSLKEWTPDFEEMIIEKWVPTGVQLVSDLLLLHLESLLQRLHLEEIVRDQVQAFSVERLEELVLSISKKEFKMITYLGAVLGGVIGLIQGFIVLLIG